MNSSKPSFFLFSNIGGIKNKFKLLANFYSNCPRRALMYVPGDDKRKINKALTLEVDCIALDCEDGVALNKKDAARDTIKSVLDQENLVKENKKHYDLGVRINSLNTNIWKLDLESALTGKYLPDTVMVPKVQCPEDIQLFSEEAAKYLKGRKINLIVFIETALAFINLIDICKKLEEIEKNNLVKPVAMVFGSDDFCANIGATRTEDSIEILYARQKLVLAAKAFRLQAIDMVYIKYQDLDGLKNQCEQGMRMGFTGKQVIHPGQVPIVQNAFFPSDSQIKWASELLKSFEKHQKEGKYLSELFNLIPHKLCKSIPVTVSECCKFYNWRNFQQSQKQPTQ